MFFGDFPDFFSFLVDEIVIFDRRTLLTSRRGDANDQKARRGERERACVTEPYCIGEGERKVVVVVDFLVTICPCPVLAAAAPAFFFLSFFLPYAGVCKYVASSEGDCQMAAAV